jgi:hypothetical protein
VTNETLFPGLEDPTVEGLMAGYSKRRLAETIVVNQRQLDQLSRELATVEEVALILTAQRDRLLEFLGVEARTADAGCHLYAGEVIERAMDIMITDPRDEATP